MTNGIVITGLTLIDGPWYRQSGGFLFYRIYFELEAGFKNFWCPNLIAPRVAHMTHVAGSRGCNLFVRMRNNRSLDRWTRLNLRGISWYQDKFEDSKPSKPWIYWLVSALWKASVIPGEFFFLMLPYLIQVRWKFCSIFYWQRNQLIFIKFDSDYPSFPLPSLERNRSKNFVSIPLVTLIFFSFSLFSRRRRKYSAQQLPSNLHARTLSTCNSPDVNCYWLRWPVLGYS